MEPFMRRVLPPDRDLAVVPVCSRRIDFGTIQENRAPPRTRTWYIGTVNIRNICGVRGAPAKCFADVIDDDATPTAHHLCGASRASLELEKTLCKACQCIMRFMP